MNENNVMTNMSSNKVFLKTTCSILLAKKPLLNPLSNV